MDTTIKRAHPRYLGWDFRRMQDDAGSGRLSLFSGDDEDYALMAGIHPPFYR